MLAGVQVRQLQGSGQWIVTSASDPGAAYETDGVSCTCAAAQLGSERRSSELVANQGLEHSRLLDAQLRHSA